MKETRGVPFVGFRLALTLAMIILAGLPEILGWNSRSAFAHSLQYMPEAAPLSPEFLKYQKDLAAGRIDTLTLGRHGLGYIPAPIGTPVPQKVRFSSAKASYASKFDLRTSGRVTAIRDQGMCGSCWAHSPLASLESFLRKGKKTFDFSEADLNDNHGFDFPTCDGGNDFMAMAYLASWKGPVLESSYPYPYTSATGAATQAAPGVAVQKHIQNVVLLPNRSDPTDNNDIKWAITSYGAVSVNFEWSSAYYNSAKASYYFSGTPSSNNHAVAVVGWDDTYDKNNFNTPAPQNGAFIVKNSWGTGWGDKGYFYMSYYDPTLAVGNVYNSAEATTGYKRIYEYDPLGLVDSFGFTQSSDPSTVWMANVFTASQEAGKITAISIYTRVKNCSYAISIYDKVPIDYRNPAQNIPTNGTLKTATPITGKIAYPGYHTLKLPKGVSVTPNKKFSVVVKLATPGFNYPIPVEYPIPGYSSAASSYIGQSYVTDNPSNGWLDISDPSNGLLGNVCIKAFGG